MKTGKCTVRIHYNPEPAAIKKSQDIIVAALRAGKIKLGSGKQAEQVREVIC